MVYISYIFPLCRKRTVRFATLNQMADPSSSLAGLWQCSTPAGHLPRRLISLLQLGYLSLAVLPRLLFSYCSLHDPHYYLYRLVIYR